MMTGFWGIKWLTNKAKSQHTNLTQSGILANFEWVMEQGMG